MKSPHFSGLNRHFFPWFGPPRPASRGSDMDSACSIKSSAAAMGVSVGLAMRRQETPHRNRSLAKHVLFEMYR